MLFERHKLSCARGKSMKRVKTDLICLTRFVAR
jgi:hypothetical protein